MQIALLLSQNFFNTMSEIQHWVHRRFVQLMLLSDSSLHEDGLVPVQKLLFRRQEPLRPLLPEDVVTPATVGERRAGKKRNLVFVLVVWKKSRQV